MAKKPKSLVFLERAADRTAELLAGVVGMRRSRRAVAVGVFLIGVQAGIAEVAEERSVITVAAALGDDVDGGAFRAAVLGREALGADLELLNGFERKLHHRAADGVVLVVDAVQGHVHVTAAVTVDGEDGVTVLGGIVGVGKLDARSQVSKVGHIAADKGKLLDFGRE